MTILKPHRQKLHSCHALLALLVWLCISNPYENALKIGFLILEFLCADLDDSWFAAM